MDFSNTRNGKSRFAQLAGQATIPWTQKVANCQTATHEDTNQMSFGHSACSFLHEKKEHFLALGLACWEILNMCPESPKHKESCRKLESFVGGGSGMVSSHCGALPSDLAPDLHLRAPFSAAFTWRTRGEQVDAPRYSTAETKKCVQLCARLCASWARCFSCRARIGRA